MPKAERPRAYSYPLSCVEALLTSTDGSALSNESGPPLAPIVFVKLPRYCRGWGEAGLRGNKWLCPSEPTKIQKSGEKLVSNVMPEVALVPKLFKRHPSSLSGVEQRLFTIIFAPPTFESINKTTALPFALPARNTFNVAPTCLKLRLARVLPPPQEDAIC